MIESPNTATTITPAMSDRSAEYSIPITLGTTDAATPTTTTYNAMGHAWVTEVSTAITST